MQGPQLAACGLYRTWAVLWEVLESMVIGVQVLGAGGGERVEAESAELSSPKKHARRIPRLA